MKIVIDGEGCIGCGTCKKICPEVFRMGKDRALTKRSVFARLPEECAKAIMKCPASAINIKK